jgi:hypothetical protein
MKTQTPPALQGLPPPNNESKRCETAALVLQLDALTDCLKIGYHLRYTIGEVGVVELCVEGGWPKSENAVLP